VVGGGPAGMEAQRVAALRGQQVTLCERGEQLGGAVCLAAAGPGRERLALIADWLERQIRSLDITIHLGAEITPESVGAGAPDAVIVAVGGQPGRRPAIRFEGITPAGPRDVLAGNVPAAPGKAVLLDQIGNQVGMAVAEWLHAHGWQVEVVSEDMFAGQRLTATQELTAWNGRAAAKGVVFRPMVDVARVAGRSVYGEDRWSRAPVQIDDVDLVVDITYETPDEALYFALKSRGVRVLRAGDCTAPRTISQAILEGHRAGREV